MKTRFPGSCLLLAVIALLPMRMAHAVGTAANTPITNTATANYNISGTPATPVTGSVSLTVDEVIDVEVTAPATATTVGTPDTDKVLAFTVTNTGNGSESFTFTASYSPTPVTDDFDPSVGTSGQLFLDVNNDGVYQSGTDTAIGGAVNLTADQSRQILLLANIPGSLSDGDTGDVTLKAHSTTAGAAPAGTGAAVGTQLATVGDGGVDAVVGVGSGGAADSGADDVETGTYVVSNVVVQVVKTVIGVTDQFGTVCAVSGGNASPCMVPGATVEYRISVTVTSASGSVAQSLQVTDDIPANTTYVTNSIEFNNAARTDIADPDNAFCSGCGNGIGTVTVNVGNVTGTAGGVVNQVDFKVTIN